MTCIPPFPGTPPVGARNPHPPFLTHLYCANVERVGARNSSCAMAFPRSLSSLDSHSAPTRRFGHRANKYTGGSDTPTEGGVACHRTTDLPPRRDQRSRTRAGLPSPR